MHRLKIVVIVLCILASAMYYPAKVVWITLGGGAAEYITGSGAPNSATSAIMNVAMWFLIFGIAFWGFVSLSAMLTMKKVILEAEIFMCKVSALDETRR